MACYVLSGITYVYVYSGNNLPPLFDNLPWSCDASGRAVRKHKFLSYFTVLNMWFQEK